MMDYPDTADRFREAGSRRAVEYSWEVISEEVIGYYRELLRLYGGSKSGRLLNSVSSPT